MHCVGGPRVQPEGQSSHLPALLTQGKPTGPIWHVRVHKGETMGIPNAHLRVHKPSTVCPLAKRSTCAD